MKQHLIVSLILICALFLIPWLGAAPLAVEPPAEETPPPVETPQSQPQPETIPTGALDSAVTLRVLVDGVVREMDMGAYLVGVVRSEMPASFEMEALKAQAVAARTYTLYKMRHGGSENHPETDACDDITCCKAYMDAATAAAQWGAAAAEYEEKLRAAVTDTDGECVLYDGAPILAVFHSSSAAVTLDAETVWSSAMPYLKSVPSPEGSDTVPNYFSSSTFTLTALKSLLQAALPEAKLEGSPLDWFTDRKILENGTVSTLKVGGVEVTGSRLRAILGLRSACFTLEAAEDGVSFAVTGYGHGVGMSQYGANVLASGGMDYREILTWYYTDTTVGVYEL